MTVPRRNSKQEIVDFFNNQPVKPFKVEEVSHELGLSVQWSRVLLKSLADSGFLKSTKQPIRKAHQAWFFEKVDNARNKNS